MNRYRIEKDTTFLHRRFDDVFEELLRTKFVLMVSDNLIKEGIKREAFHTRTYFTSLLRGLKGM